MLFQTLGAQNSEKHPGYRNVGIFCFVSNRQMAEAAHRVSIVLVVLLSFIFNRWRHWRRS